MAKFAYFQGPAWRGAEPEGSAFGILGRFFYKFLKNPLDRLLLSGYIPSIFIGII
jgi:hypothetical protein